MTDKKASAPQTFRPWPENKERLEFAKKIGFDLSEVVNEVLAKHLKPTLELKTKKLRETLAAPCP